MQQARRVQGQTVAARPARQLPHRPAPQRPEGREVLTRPREASKTPGERGLAADARDRQQRSHQHVAPQVRHVGELFRPGQNPGEEAQRKVRGRDRLGARAHVGRTSRNAAQIRPLSLI